MPPQQKPSNSSTLSFYEVTVGLTPLVINAQESWGVGGGGAGVLTKAGTQWSLRGG